MGLLLSCLLALPMRAVSAGLDELVAEHHDHMQHQADTHRNAVDKLLLEASSDED